MKIDKKLIKELVENLSEFNLTELGVLPNLHYKFITNDYEEELIKREIDVLDGDNEFDLKKAKEAFYNCFGKL